MPLAQRGARRIHWEVEGAGPDVILIPGTGAGAGQFGTLPRRFARHGYRCITYSPLGIPPSSPLPGEFDFDEAAEDVLAVLDAAESERCVPVGTSLGGKVALVACNRAPDRLPAMAMIGSSAVVTARAQRVYRCFAIAADRLQSDELAQLLAPFVFGRTFHENRSAMVDDVTRAMRPDGALMASQARSLQAFDGVPLARAYPGPALCVAGAEDVLTPAEEVRATADLLPQGRYVEIANAGHAMLLESPAAFEAVATFLAD